MGLDMFLYVKLPEEEMKEIYYWRKSNHFHRWFVENCQDENDDCGTYPVSWEQLEELLNILNKILYCEFKDNRKNIIAAMDKTQIELAEELLPTQSGFFFGGTDYDEYYFEDLKKTKEFLENLLKNKEGEIYYSSSW